MKIRHTPNFDEFLKVLQRSGKPKHLPFYEHYASPGFISRRTDTKFDQMSPDDPAYWEIYRDFWLNMGYDCVPMEVPLNCPLNRDRHGKSEGSESSAVIRNRADYEAYPWPEPDRAVDFRHFETMAAIIPEGVKIVAGVAMGPYEWASHMLGVMGLSYLLADDPELVTEVFNRLGKLSLSVNRRLAAMDEVGALRQGDDLGFKTATFLRPEDLRRLVFPIYKDFARSAHEAGKPFILHSCGNLSEVYEDLITNCRIDAKHSFEDIIMPVIDFKAQYGRRITPLGGLDVDFICRAEEKELRAYTRKHIDACFSDGYWALGTGNSLTDYMPVENYLIVLDEGRRYTGSY